MASNFSKPKPIGIDQVMTSRAHLVAGVHRQPLPIGHGLGFLNRRQIGVHAGRRRRHLLAQKLLPNEKPRPVGAVSSGLLESVRNRRLSQKPGTLRLRRELDTVEVARRRRIL